MNEIRIPLRTLRIFAPALLVAIMLGAAFGLPTSRAAIEAAVAGPMRLADDATLSQQREAAEKAVGRGFMRQVDLLSKVRELRLSMSNAEAEARMSKALSDLQVVRHEAWRAIAGAYGADAVTADARVKELEARFERSQDDRSSVLLAPILMAIVARADQLYGALGDQALRDLTAAPPETPSSRP